MCSRLRRVKIVLSVNRVLLMPAPPRCVGSGAGQGKEHFVERCLAAGDVDGIDAGFVERSHHVDDSHAGLEGSGDDEFFAVERWVVVGEGRESAGRGDQLAGTCDLHVDAIVADPGLQIFGRAVGNGLAVVEHDDVVGHAIGLFEVLRREDDGGALAHEIGEHLPQIAAAAWVETGRRLVEEQHLGATHQAGRHIEPAAHAPRVGLHQRCCEIGEVELLEQFVAALACCGLRHPTKSPDRLEVETGAHQAVDGGLLRRDTDAASNGSGLAHDIEPGNGGAAFCRLAERGEDADGRGLACSVVTQQTEDRAGSDVQVEVAQRPQIAEPFPEPGGGDSTSGRL